MNLNYLVVKLIDLYMIVLLVRCVLSFVPHNRFHPAVQFLYRITEPVLDPIRRVIPPIGGVLDISPLIVMLILSWVRGLFWGP